MMASQVSGDSSNPRTSLRPLLRRANVLAIWVVVGLAMLLGGILSPVFLTRVNVLNLLTQSSVLGIAALGVTFTIIVGEIDVSIAGIATVSAVMGAAIMDGENGNIAIAILVCMLFGALVGVINGLMVAQGIQSFILTLAVGTSLLAAGRIYTGGAPIGIIAPSYANFFFERRLGLSTPAWALFAAVLVAWFLLAKTRLGHRVYLVGGNRQAARVSGIKVRSTIVGAFVVSGIMAALAGLVVLGYTGVPGDFSGMNLHFQALSAVALGGAAFGGGRGGATGTLAGALLISIFIGILIFLGWPFGAQLMGYGVLILAASVSYSILKRERR